MKKLRIAASLATLVCTILFLPGVNADEPITLIETPARWAEEGVDAAGPARERRIELYLLTTDKDGVITYNAPDGFAYTIDPHAVAEGKTLKHDDQKKRARFYFAKRVEGIRPDKYVLLLSIRVEADQKSAPAATLLHSDDDEIDRTYRTAVDEGGQHGFNTAHLMLTSDFPIPDPDFPERPAPLGVNKRYYVMVVYPTTAESVSPLASGP